MKHFLRSLIIASTLIISATFHTQHSQAAELRSPCVLSESEKATITDLTHLRAPLDSILAGVKECVVFSDNSILIHYMNGHVAIFGLGDAPTVSFPVVKDQKEFAPQNVINVLPDSKANHAEHDQERKIFTKLSDVWEISLSSGQLSPKDLAKADALVQEMFATVPNNEIQLASYNVLGLRGNRYLPIIQELPSLSSEAAVTFYEGYLGSSDPYARAEDMPTDGDKQIAIEKLVQIFEISELDMQYRFTFSASQEIKRIDPVSYEKMKAHGVMTEDTQ